MNNLPVDDTFRLEVLGDKRRRDKNRDGSLGTRISAKRGCRNPPDTFHFCQ
jgi:hypothetical protein